MHRSKHGKILYWVLGALLILTMLTSWLVSGMLAKFVTRDSNSGDGRVASGGVVVSVKEHEAVLVNGIYYLKDGTNEGIKGAEGEKEVIKNFYKKVIPGVDIPKDPFVRLTGTAEVDFELYIWVNQSRKFPDTVTYTIDDTYWEKVETGLGELTGSCYKYKGRIESNTLVDLKIPILMDNQLIVGEKYIGIDGDFSLSFEAWLVQID